MQNEKLYRGKRESRSSYFRHGQEDEPLGGERQMFGDVARINNHNNKRMKTSEQMNTFRDLLITFCN